MEIDQNVGIQLKNEELFRILKFEGKVGNRWKCWNLSANCQIDQNVNIWVKSGESIKKLTFECNKMGIDENVEIWVQNVKSIKMLKFEYKVRSIKMLKFVPGAIDQNVEI